MNHDSRSNGQTIDSLKRELQQVRQGSVSAMRRGVFRRVAQLSNEAARLNRRIAELELQLELGGQPA